MNVYVHDEKITLPESISLQKALNILHLSHCAVLINSKFVPRSLHSSVSLKADDKIELITPMQGG